MAFHVGQQVVCIRDDWRYLYIGEVAPIKGSIYTIRKIRDRVEKTWLLFEEFSNPVRRGLREPGFDANFFRPVRTTSIEIFERLLKPVETEAA